MRLYYFTSSHWGLVATRDKRLKLSRYGDLNDPFDFVGIATEEPAQRKQLAVLRNNLGSKAGIVCMSATWREPLLWGHYADKHKGICLGFDVKDSLWEEISYVDERPKLSDFGKDAISELTADDVKKISTTKFANWSYEREYRRFIDLSKKKVDFVDGNYFLEFSDVLELKQVIFGERSTVTDAQIEAVRSNHPAVEIMHSRAAYSRFEVVKHVTKSEKWALRPARKAMT